MGICNQQYRCVVGSYNASCLCPLSCCSRYAKRKGAGGSLLSLFLSLNPFGIIFYSIYMTYFVFFILSFALVMSNYGIQHKYYNINHTLSVKVLVNVSSRITLLNCKFMCILSETILFILPTLSPKKIVKYISLKYASNIGFVKYFSFALSLFITSLNLSLIVISNVSLINPGPVSSISGLSVHYQNVQGFVNFSTLGCQDPSLNLTKVIEFQSHISITKPDVIILNETWLKPSIRNIEILPFSDYKIFRLDRSIESHPLDPTNPRKFKRNGGGVLIAIKSSLDLKPTLMKSKSCTAEMLSVTLSIGKRKRICLSTVYRVGTLGDANFQTVKSHLNNIAKTRSIISHHIIGDFNLDTINWTSGTTSNNLHNNFLNLFHDVGLVQLISSPTHYQGNILDLLLTDQPSRLSNIVVHDRNECLKSDHMLISFLMKIKVKRIRKNRRSIYNFSKANWEALNNDLRSVDWNSGLLNGCHIFSAWNTFKTILFALCDKHIPKVKVSSKGQPPWFDSDIHNLCRKKERHRKAFKLTSNPVHEAKFKNCRKEIKKNVKEKMRSNFNDESNPNCLTKKFWSYVKSSSNTSRIPDKVSCGGVFKSDPSGKANLFNDYFSEQFSRPSNYNIDIDFPANDHFINFRISSHTVHNILKSLDANKAFGPDGISGKILKNCAFSLSYPLSILFNLSYNMGQIPQEWKLANIVPVHKKGDKSLVENYRPISLTCLVMKVFERSISKELLSACIDRIHPSQHGFLPGRSCTTQLIPFVDSLSLALIIIISQM